jgi:serine/threonine-protein kinase RsbW
MRTRLTLHNDSADFVRLTEFAAEFSHQHKLPEEERARLLIILDELFTNVVQYGYDSATAEGHIDVGLSLQAGRLIIEFVDDGRPFDPLASAAPDLDLPADERPVGGVGIAIVRALVDEIGYRWDGSHNRLTLGRNVLQPPAVR